MKLGIGDSCFRDEKTSRTDFALAASYGYDCYDYDLTQTDSEFYQADEETFRRMMLEERKRAEEAGIECYQVHGPWPTDDLTRESRAQKLIYMKRGLLGAALMGSKCFVIHPVMPYGWGAEPEHDLPRALTKELLLQLSDYALPLGVTVCLENMPFLGHALSTVRAVADLVEEIGRDNVKICFDTGHANLYPEDIGDQVRRCGRNLACLHIHDNTGVRDDHTWPYTGTVNWQSFKKALKDVGFSGCLSLETGMKSNTPKELYDILNRALFQILKTLDE